MIEQKISFDFGCRYGSYTGMDIWRPPELGDVMKTAEEILYDAQSRDLESKMISEAIEEDCNYRRRAWENRSREHSPPARFSRHRLTG